MYLNFITAFTNFSALYPIKVSIVNGDYTTACVIMIMFLASFISHIAENHKHGMGDETSSKTLSYILNRIDVAMVFVLSSRICWLLYERFSDEAYSWGIWSVILVYFPNYKGLLISLALLFICNLLSESEKTIATRTRYVLLHSVWHLGVFGWLGVFLEQVY